MANPNKPAGLVPVQYLNGSPWNMQARTYFIPSSDTNAYAIGDPVVSVAGADSNGVQQVVLATAGAGNPLRGVVVGLGKFEYLMANPASLDSSIIPATKTFAWYVMVADDPNILFQIQESNTSPFLTAANVGQNANLSSGTNNGFISQWVLNNVGTASTANFQLKIMGLQRTADNTFGQFAKWLVRINNHELANQTVI